jgi:hypothetical protein
VKMRLYRCGEKKGRTFDRGVTVRPFCSPQCHGELHAAVFHHPSAEKRIRWKSFFLREADRCNVAATRTPDARQRHQRRVDVFKKTTIKMPSKVRNSFDITGGFTAESDGDNDGLQTFDDKDVPNHSIVQTTGPFMLRDVKTFLTTEFRPQIAVLPTINASAEDNTIAKVIWNTVLESPAVKGDGKRLTSITVTGTSEDLVDAWETYVDGLNWTPTPQIAEHVYIPIKLTCGAAGTFEVYIEITVA